MTEQKPRAVRYSENSVQATLWQFKTVIETGDVRFLLILDNYDELPEFDIKLLTTAWHEIYQDFSNVAGGSRADLWMVKVKRLTSMQMDFQRHSSILRVIEMYPVQDLVDEAKEDGYAIDLDDFDKTFEKAYTRLMKMKNQINIFEKEQAKDETKDQSIEGLIVELEKFQGYGFDEHKMNVKKFANIYKKYKNA